MKIRKVSSVTVEISQYSEKTEHDVTLTVPWKERFRILFFGKLHIKVWKTPMMTFSAKVKKVVNTNEAD